MNTARLVIFSALALLVLATACNRSASTPPPGEGEGGVQATNQAATVEAVRAAILTQTAVAGDGAPEAVPTEAPPEPTEAPEEQPTAVGIVYVEYTVQEGDTIFGIAESFGVEPQAILDLNGLTEPGQVTVLMVLKIPPSTGEAPTPAPTTVGGGGGTVHVVKPGEWVWQIARIYNVDPNAIIEANNLQTPSLIFPGMELVIP